MSTRGQHQPQDDLLEPQTFFVASYSKGGLPDLTSNLCWTLISALTLPTLPPCHAADASALQLGRPPANPFTPRKHKQIDKFQITPPFISTLVFHLLPESYPLFPLLLPDGQIQVLTHSCQSCHKHASQGLDLWPASVRSCRVPSCQMTTAHPKAKGLNNRSKWDMGKQKRPKSNSLVLHVRSLFIHPSLFECCLWQIGCLREVVERP